jgi:hypothetical protein
MEDVLKKAEEKLKEVDDDNLEKVVQSELSENLAKSAQRWIKSGKSTFWVVKKIAQVAKPIAKFRRRQDIMIIIKGIEDACDAQDKDACKEGIRLLNKQTKNEIMMPVEAAREIVSSWYKKRKEKEVSSK